MRKTSATGTQVIAYRGPPFDVQPESTPFEDAVLVSPTLRNLLIEQESRRARHRLERVLLRGGR